MAKYQTGDLALYDRRWAGVVLCRDSGDIVEDCHNDKIKASIEAARQLVILNRPTVVSFFKTLSNVGQRALREDGQSKPSEKKLVEQAMTSVVRGSHYQPVSSPLLETIFREAAAMQRFSSDQFAIVHYLLFARLP